MKQDNQWLQERVDIHFTLQTEIAQKEEELNKLKERSAKVSTEMFDHVNAIKGKKVELPSCIVSIKKEKDVKVGKTSTKWKEVFTKINDTWDIPQKWVDALIKKYTVKAKTTVTYISSLLIEKK